MRVLYVQNPQNMIGFFNEQIKNNTCNNSVIQRGRGGLRNAIGQTREHVVSTGQIVKAMMSPPKNANLTLVDPNVKSVNQAKEEMNRDAQTVIPVETGIKRKKYNTSGTKPKKARTNNDNTKKPTKKATPKKKTTPVKTALSL